MFLNKKKKKSIRLKTVKILIKRVNKLIVVYFTYNVFIIIRRIIVYFTFKNYYKLNNRSAEIFLIFVLELFLLYLKIIKYYISD